MTTLNKSGNEVRCCDIITDGRKSQVFNTAKLNGTWHFASFQQVLWSFNTSIDNVDGLSSDSRELIDTEAQTIYLCVSDDNKLGNRKGGTIMKFKKGETVTIKSLEWYDNNKRKMGISHELENFARTCLYIVERLQK